MRPILPFLLVALTACAPQDVVTVAASEQDLPVRSALYASAPNELDTAFRLLCDSPGDELRRVSRSVVQCRILPRPDLAAFLLLEFNGALEAPTLVLQKQTSEVDGQYVVEISRFAEVVQKSGNPRRIYFKNRSFDELIDELLEKSGGLPNGT